MDMHQWHELVQSLPELQFSVPHDGDFSQSAMAQQYLNYYGITTPNVATHGFGHFMAAGYRIAAHYWLPPNPQGSLLILHGYYDHTGLYGNAIHLGLEKNCAVFMFDLPGHGLSSGDQASITSFDEYSHVLQRFLEMIEPLAEQPLDVIAQSTGASVLLNHWRLYPSQSYLYQSWSLLAPLIRPYRWLWYVGLVRVLNTFVDYVPRKFSSTAGNPTFAHFIEHEDPLQARVLSLQWTSALRRWLQVVEQTPIVTIPVQVFQGEEDMTVDGPYNIAFLETLCEQLQVQRLPNAGHHLINETDSNLTAMLASIVDFMLKAGGSRT